MLKTAVLRAKEDGNQVIVGGYSTVELAKQCDVPAVMIRSGREAVNQAITEALALAAVTVYEREKRDEIASIMNYSFQGIISVNRKGMITLANSCCYSYMKERKEPLTGADIREVFPGIRIEEVIHQKKKILSEVCDCSGRPVMVNCVPVSGESQDFGAVITFQGTEQIQAEEGKLRKRIYSTGFTAKYDFTHILYKSSVMEKLIQTAEKYSYADSNILIHGETGTGKEMFARAIHNASDRCGNPFITVNCAAIPMELLESELFGYDEGAFTGAKKGGKIGKFELANTGTIFLDEIGDMPFHLQAKLLRVLQQRKVTRVGGTEPIDINVRVIAATNKNLEQMVREGQFREDLYYRLNVVSVQIPPLRERKEDIVPLLNHFLTVVNQKYHTQKTIFSDTIDAFENYPWPGNVRELENVLANLVITTPGDEIRRENLPKKFWSENGEPAAMGMREILPLKVTVERVELAAIQHAIDQCGSVRKAAAALGVDPSTIVRKMQGHKEK